ncbi:MAG: hypothetical protein ACOCWM_05360 [Cyclobacteriaceae bacterium]
MKQKILIFCGLLVIAAQCYSQKSIKISEEEQVSDYKANLPEYVFNNKNFNEVSVFQLENLIMVHVSYKVEGLFYMDYPYRFGEDAEDGFEQTAWDTLYVISKTTERLISKITLDLFTRSIKAIEILNLPNKTLTFIKYQKGFELHRLTNFISDSVLVSNQDANLAAISKDGEKITYLTYKEFSVLESSYFSNCLVDFYIDSKVKIPYNRLQTMPIDRYESNDDGIRISRDQAVPDSERIDSITYNSDNQLVCFRDTAVIFQMKTSYLNPPNLVYDEEIENEEPIVITSEYIDDFLYILFHAEDIETGYSEYLISKFSIPKKKFLVQVKVEPDKNGTIEYNPETESSPEIQHKLTFNLKPDIAKDSTLLNSLLPPNHNFSFINYSYAIKDSILVFSCLDGLVKMNLSSQEYITFGDADILTWYGLDGYTEFMFDYKSIYITSDNKIITLQKNSKIMVWEI